MTISGNDIFGAFIDTGVAIPPSRLPNITIEAPHLPNEIDTGSTNKVAVTATRQVPSRPAGTPR
jgi:hypothetical protein